MVDKNKKVKPEKPKRRYSLSFVLWIAINAVGIEFLIMSAFMYPILMPSIFGWILIALVLFSLLIVDLIYIGFKEIKLMILELNQ